MNHDATVEATSPDQGGMTPSDRNGIPDETGNLRAHSVPSVGRSMCCCGLIR